MDAGDLQPDILLDALVIFSDILHGLFCGTAAVPVLLFSSFTMIGVLPVIVLLLIFPLLGSVTGIGLTVILSSIFPVVVSSFPVLIAFVIGAVIASFGLIFGAEYFIFALATKLICFILKETWFGWKIAFFAYLIVVILRTIYYIFHKETTN